MTSFSLSAPKRTIFGRDSRASAATEIAAFGTRILLVRGQSVAWVDKLVDALTRSGCLLETVISSGEPVLDAVRQAISVTKNHKADCVVAVGGGSVIDLGKAVAGLCRSDGDVIEYLGTGEARARQLHCPLPFIAIPTTAGTGAEATRNAVIGVPERQVKISLRDQRLLPDLVLIDPALTDSSPKGLTLASGLDAITQLIESYVSNRSNLVTDAMCRTSIPKAIAALCELMDGENTDARDEMARASYLSGIALTNSGLGIVHGLASIIGGRGGAHGAICGRLLASALFVNEDVLKDEQVNRMRFIEVDKWLADGLIAQDVSGKLALRHFVDTNELPSLKDLGVHTTEFEAIAQLSLASSSTKANPVKLNKKDVCRILELA